MFIKVNIFNGRTEKLRRLSSHGLLMVFDEPPPEVTMTPSCKTLREHEKHRRVLEIGEKLSVCEGKKRKI